MQSILEWIDNQIVVEKQQILQCQATVATLEATKKKVLEDGAAEAKECSGDQQPSKVQSQKKKPAGTRAFRNKHADDKPVGEQDAD